MINQRESNIELFRIIAMLLIVAHHLSLYSGMIAMATEMPLSVNALFVNLFGMWGKIGINCFLLITGYYMCTSTISLRKWIKLVLWIWFYNAVINTLFMTCGYVDFTMHTVLRVLLPISRVGSQFASTFVVFYLFIPFLNVIINNIDNQMHQWLLILIALVFVILPYFPVYVLSFNYLIWFICVYFFASYLRLRINEIQLSRKFWITSAALSLCLAISSVIVSTYTNLWNPYYFVSDSNALLALPVAITVFMFMKQLHMRQNKIINIVSASCFGVLLIHDNTIMRRWLWNDVLHASNLYHLPNLRLVLLAILIVFAVYTLCTLIDMARMYCIEEPLFKWLDKQYGKYVIWFNR